MLITKGLIPSPHVLCQELEDETVLLQTQTEQYFGLDDVGTRVWQLLGEHSDVEAVVKQMLKEFEVDETVIRADIAALLADLKAAKLLVERE